VRVESEDVDGETIAGRYELEEVVGTGGMSTVWRARDRLLERNVAIKILHARYGEDDDYVERFKREARAVAQLSHPNIVTVIDRGEDRERQFIVFEFVEGENLKQVLERRGALPIEEVVELGLEIARGLAFAHERGIVHRDVKPQNVLLNGDGRAKVTDFGIARSLNVERGLTHTGTVMGTSNYIAPEQATGAHVDARSDVYALGCVLFELLTGEVPFPGDNFVTVALQHLNEPPPPVLERRRDAPPQLAWLVDRALAKNPADRPSMDEVVAGLGTARDPSQATAVLPRAVRSRRRRNVRWPVVLALAGLLLIAAAVVGALVLSGNVDPPGGDAAAPRPVVLTAVRSHDPQGPDRTEHESEVANATDRDPSTAWRTERYRFGGGSLGKPGVGIVVSTGNPRELGSFTIITDSPGIRAEIQANGTRVSPSRELGRRTRLQIRPGTRASEWVVWITSLGPHSQAQLNEVQAAPAA
jgi:eukaryotic-like serine/threonine-protein kinase